MFPTGKRSGDTVSCTELPVEAIGLGAGTVAIHFSTGSSRALQACCQAFLPSRIIIDGSRFIAELTSTEIICTCARVEEISLSFLFFDYFVLFVNAGFLCSNLCFIQRLVFVYGCVSDFLTERLFLTDKGPCEFQKEKH